MTRLFATFLICFVASTAGAQPTRFDHLTSPLSTTTARRVADITSWGTVGTAILLDVRAALKSDDRTHALQMTGARLLSTWAWASIAKGLAHRERPCARLSEGCGMDQTDTSFYSMHTAFAFSGIGGPRLQIVLPLATGTGGLRIAAGKHYLTDVLVGAGIGALTSRIR